MLLQMFILHNCLSEAFVRIKYMKETQFVSNYNFVGENECLVPTFHQENAVPSFFLKLIKN